MTTPQIYPHPLKRVGAGALFFNGAGELLIVKPIYKGGWLVPGGAVEENESPREGCIRETKEEIGLDIDITRLLSIDSVGVQPDRPTGLNFTFYGGILSDEQIASIMLQGSELSEYRFIARSDLASYFPERKISRFNLCFKAIEDGNIYYLENGHSVS